MNKYESEQLKFLLDEKERTTNKSNSRVMAAVTICILLFILLPLAGLIPKYYVLLSYSLGFAAAMIMCVALHVCLVGKYKRSCHKYIIIMSTALSAALMYVALGSDAVVLFANPLLLSGRYGSRRICMVTYLTSVSLCFLAGITYAVIDTEYYHYSTWIKGIEDMATMILPMLTMVTVMAVIVYGMVASDLKSMMQILAAREKTAIVETEFKTGAELQMNSLPKDFNLAPDGEFSIYAKLIPSKETAGDFYDFFIIDGKRAVFIIGDVSDKGVPAALYMMSARNTIRTLCRVMDDPADVMTEANRILLETSSDAFVTVFIAFVDLETGAGKYVNAGHDSPIICYGNGSCGFMDDEPQPIAGAFDFAEYKSSPLQLDKGSILFLYTDGLNEAVNSDCEEFGVDRLCEMVQDCSSEKSTEEICLSIESAINGFADNSKHSDDRTMLAVRWEMEMGISEKKTLPVAEESITEMIDAVNEALDMNGCPEFTARNIDVVIDEIGANLVEHSQATTLIFEYECGENHIRMTFTDDGIKFNPKRSRVYETRDLLAPGGLGIHFMRSLMDEVCYGYENGHNVYTITKYWD